MFNLGKNLKLFTICMHSLWLYFIWLILAPVRKPASEENKDEDETDSEASDTDGHNDKSNQVNILLVNSGADSMKWLSTYCRTPD